MRLRVAVLAAMMSTVAVIAIPAVASAAPGHNHGLTINVTPDPIMSGEAVLIYGQLNSHPVAGRKIILYHHISDSGRGYTRISTTTTDALGFYEFARAEDIVKTNRSWFTREAGVAGVHSRTVHERVGALIEISADKTSGYTNHPVVFSGHVAPNHRFERVLLQAQSGAGDDWKTLKRGRLGGDSNYAISYRFRVPGVRDVRVLLRGDRRNIRSVSDVLTVTIQQAQVADFTIHSAAPTIPFGQSTTVSGTLYAKGTTKPEPSTPVTLCSHGIGQAQFACSTAGVTGPDGGYSFPVAPVSNTVYRVVTTLSPARHTALLFEGVRDTVTLSVVPSSVKVGQPVTFTGNATPNKAGDVVYLQRLGPDHDWHTINVTVVKPNSRFEFIRGFGTAGTKTFRARIPGDPQNVGGASSALTVTVSLPPVSSLPPAT